MNFERRLNEVLEPSGFDFRQFEKARMSLPAQIASDSKDFIGISVLLPTLEDAMKNKTFVNITRDLWGVQERAKQKGLDLWVDAGKGMVRIHKTAEKAINPEDDEISTEKFQDPASAARRLSFLLARPQDQRDLEADEHDWFGG
jgi:hypothetical protein